MHFRSAQAATALALASVTAARLDLLRSLRRVLTATCAGGLAASLLFAAALVRACATGACVPRAAFFATIAFLVGLLASLLWDLVEDRWLARIAKWRADEATAWDAAEPGYPRIRFRLVLLIQAVALAAGIGISLGFLQRFVA